LPGDEQYGSQSTSTSSVEHEPYRGSNRFRNAARRWLVRGLAIALGLFVGCAVAEIGLRLLGQELFRLGTKTYLVSGTENVNYHCYPDNYSGDLVGVPDVSQGSWRLFDSSIPPNELQLSELDKTPWCVEYRMSSQKLRDREYSPSPPPGVVRVLGVGDSFAMGVGVPVERSLFRQLNAMAGLDVEIVNAARSGSYIMHEYAQVEQLTGPLNCSRVLVVFIPNDIQPNETQIKQESYINDLINLRETDLDTHVNRISLSRHSRLFELVYRWRESRRIHDETIQWYLDCYDEQQNPAGVAMIKNIFTHYASLPTAKVALVMYPMIEGLDGEYPLAPIHRQVEGIAIEAGLPVLDLAPFFAGHNPSELWVHPCDHHPNSRAHAIAAKAIYEWLTTELPWFLDPRQPLHTND